MFAIFRNRSGKLLDEMVALGEKERALVQRAKDHIAAADRVIDALLHETNQAQAVIDEIDGRDVEF